MKNLGSVLKLFLMLSLLLLLAVTMTGLYKNRAATSDFVDIACFYVVAVASLTGGVAFGLLVSMIVLFSYGSFLIINSMVSQIPFMFTAEQGLWVFMYIIVSFILGFAGDKVRMVEKMFKEYNFELEELLSTGRLSKFANIHKFGMDLEYEIARSKRSKSAFQLVLIELADLKEVERKYGKDAKAKVIDQLGKIILLNTRDTDKRARVNETTFGILLPETSVENLPVVIKKINDGLENIKIEYKDKTIKYKPAVKIGHSGFPADGDNAYTLKEKAVQSCAGIK